MELVNTGRCVRNPLQHKDFRRFQNCRHRPQQTRKYQVRTRLEMPRMKKTKPRTGRVTQLLPVPASCSGVPKPRLRKFCWLLRTESV